jgi:AAA15 family ATPase/GTPase
MFDKIRIQNFKSVYDETIELGRVNVFIGENGSGKSNLLEAVAFTSAAANNSEFNNDVLFSKGVRVAMSSLMFSSFSEKKQNKSIKINLFDNVLGDVSFNFKTTDNGYFPNWKSGIVGIEDIESFLNENQVDIIEQLSRNLITNQQFENKDEAIGALKKVYEKEIKTKLTRFVAEYVAQKTELPNLEDFLIYTANTTFLRGIHTESRKEPLGINGEGLDVLLASFDKEEIEKLKRYNYLIGWLEDFFVDMDDALKLRGYKLNRSKSVLYFKDRFMMRKNNVFSAENSNEGILHILFYLALMISKRTPKFFAIDNIESSLNPHLCREIMTIICDLAKEKDSEKQLLITTHNPAILDGLNLNDDDIRLFEVYRNNNGHTKARRIKLNADNKPEQLKLSELWTRGYLGAAPKNF